MKFNTAAVTGLSTLLVVCAAGWALKEKADRAKLDVVSAMAISDHPVLPAVAEGLEPISLNELVRLVAPTSGFLNLSWDYLTTDRRVHWTTEGIDYSRSNATRKGLVRIRAGGKTSTVIRRGVEELAWSIELATAGNPNFGPKWISIFPSEEEGHCFGAEYSNCTFDVKAAFPAGSSTTKICSVDNLEGHKEAYWVSVPNKQIIALTYSISGGSGGESSSVTLNSPGKIDTDALCSSNPVHQ